MGCPSGVTEERMGRGQAAPEALVSPLGRGQLGLACYESRLQCLKECRSELIRCSGCLTALVAQKPPLMGARAEKSGGEKHMKLPPHPFS